MMQRKKVINAGLLPESDYRIHLGLHLYAPGVRTCHGDYLDRMFLILRNYAREPGAISHKIPVGGARHTGVCKIVSFLNNTKRYGSKNDKKRISRFYKDMECFLRWVEAEPDVIEY
ncbi:MAG: hypothetical protein E6X99_23125 [Pantoea sp.]|nr:hypothetical protein [Pantoea sp.]